MSEAGGSPEKGSFCLFWGYLSLRKPKQLPFPASRGVQPPAPLLVSGVHPDGYRYAVLSIHPVPPRRNDSHRTPLLLSLVPCCSDNARVLATHYGANIKTCSAWRTATTQTHATMFCTSSQSGRRFRCLVRYLEPQTFLVSLEAI